jgi:signal transduction histidine kinase
VTVGGSPGVGAAGTVFEALVRASSTLLGNCPTALFRVGADGGRVEVVTSTGPTPTEFDQMRVKAPILLDGDVWGWLGAADNPPLPVQAPDTLSALAQLAEAVVAAEEHARNPRATGPTVADTEVRNPLLDHLAAEQGAIRRVGELVARGRPAVEILDAVAVEASDLLNGVAVTLTSYDGERHQVVEASPRGPAERGQRIWVEPDTLPDRVRVTGKPSRVDDFRLERNAELAVQFGLVAAVAVPIVVSEQIWGQLTATSSAGPLPPHAEKQLNAFADLISTALAHVQARSEVQALAEEHAALRRVAELSRRDLPPDHILDAAAREATGLAGVDHSTVLRFVDEGVTEIVVAAEGASAPADSPRARPAWEDVVQRVWSTGRAARADHLDARSTHWPTATGTSAFFSRAAAPIHIDAALWGVLVVVAHDRPLPHGIEAHLSNFTELAATAIAAAQARRELRALAEGQVALRRVAELVAQGAPLDEVFAAVSSEASRLTGVGEATLTRFVDENTGVIVATSANPVPLDLRVPTTVDTAVEKTWRTGPPVRPASSGDTPTAGTADRPDIAATVTVPVVVEGRIWGTLAAASRGPSPPPGTEEQLLHFAELAAAAIANAENKAKLTASRARVVAAADETRRRLQRDVHDSAQQRLVHTIVALQLALDALDTDHEAQPLVAEALRNAQRANQDIRDVIRGILPAALSRGGLGPGLEGLVDDLSIPVQVNIAVPRLAPALETTAYFVVAEALANVVKHAHAGRVTVNADLTDGVLVLDVSDDGRGGADPAGGSGITGLIDRVEAAGGTLTLTSPASGGTIVHVEIPTATSGQPKASGTGA